MVFVPPDKNDDCSGGNLELFSWFPPANYGTQCANPSSDAQRLRSFSTPEPLVFFMTRSFAVMA
jgi:hypothetical protein